MTSDKDPSDTQTVGKSQPTKDVIQREQAQEARFGSFEHGSPETGPGEKLYVDDISDKDAGSDNGT